MGSHLIVNESGTLTAPSSGQTALYPQSDGLYRRSPTQNNRLLTTADSDPDFILATDFNIANSQASPSNVTGLLLTGKRSYWIFISYYRQSSGGGAQELAASAILVATYKTVANTYSLSFFGVDGDVDVGTGQPAGVTLSISSGQVQYISTTITGTPVTQKLSFTAKALGA